MVLSNIASMSIKRKGMFEPYLKSFYVRSNDPTQVKLLKVSFVVKNIFHVFYLLFTFLILRMLFGQVSFYLNDQLVFYRNTVILSSLKSLPILQQRPVFQRF